MPGVVHRMNKLRALLSIRQGPGAAILPTQVTRIHMDFAFYQANGHMGPRKFWRDNLPRLKYWNPAIPMIVNRHSDNSVPPTMTIYFRDDNATAPSEELNATLHSSTKNETKAPLPADGERTVTIEMRNQHSTTILKEFLSKTGAVLVTPTQQELVEMEEAEELKQRGEVDRVRMKKDLEAARREKSLMAQAKTEAAAFKSANV